MNSCEPANAMDVAGACLCGAVQYACAVEQASVMICHCAECQVMGSSAFRIGAFIREDRIELIGETREYRRDACIGARAHVYCPICATVIYSYTPDSEVPGIVLGIGTTRQRSRLAPHFQIRLDDALEWTSTVGDIAEANPGDMLARQAGRS